MSKGAKTTLSPEEIRHLAFSRRGRGYARDEVDRVLADVADSFEAVWHERTRLYEEVLQLREQLKADKSTIAELRGEAERTKAEREASRSEIARAQAPPVSEHPAEQPPSSVPPEGAEGYSDLTQRFWEEKERLLGDVEHGGAVGAEERQKLLDFLLDALKQVERVPANGSEPSLGPDGSKRDDESGAQDQGHPRTSSPAEGSPP